MMTRTGYRPEQHPHLDHLFKIGILNGMANNKRLSKATRSEAAAELVRYRDEGLIVQRYSKEEEMPKTTRAHSKTYSGQGVMFVVIDDREKLKSGKVTTIEVIADAIESALDAGHETSDEIARYLTTSAFQHIPDKRIRFNSVLKANDAVGAQITRKMYNAYNELSALADEEDDKARKAEIRAEATGFAEALSIVLSPFSCEDPEDPRLVNWDEVDRITASFEKEQRFVIKERKGKLQ